MKVLLLLLLAVISVTANSQTYYFVRHAEKAQAATNTTMKTTGNPPLSPAGEARAKALKDLLKDKHIRNIFSTNTIRTVSTATPLATATHTRIEIYDKADRDFIDQIKARHNNTLIVGHSDTVDDIVNMLSNADHVHADLPDWQYDRLFVVTIRGKKISFKVMKYGKASIK
jgi:broad specificity phosphatase PhoE